MALDTHTLKVGESRILGIRVSRTVAGSTTRIAPDSATINVIDSEEEDVIGETAATISGTSIYHLVTGSNVTAEAGTYTVIWKVTEGTEIFIETQPVVVEAVT